MSPQPLHMTKRKNQLYCRYAGISVYTKAPFIACQSYLNNWSPDALQLIRHSGSELLAVDTITMITRFCLYTETAYRVAGAWDMAFWHFWYSIGIRFSLITYMWSKVSSFSRGHDWWSILVSNYVNTQIPFCAGMASQCSFIHCLQAFSISPASRTKVLNNRIV